MTTETTGRRSPSEPGQSSTDPRAAAERVLELVRARAGDAEAEITVQRGTSALTRFANSFIHQNVAEETSHLTLRVAIDGRTATARLDGPADGETLKRLVDGALESARIRPVDPDWPGVAPVAAAPIVEHWDEATAAAAPDDRARLVADFVAAAGGLETAGACSTSETVAAFANSLGQRLTGRTTRASLDGIARTGSSDGSGRASSVTIADLDGRLVGERAARKARESRNATDLEPGRYEVVLEPQCVSNMLQFLFVYGFNGRAVEEDRSFVRLDEAQFDPSITLCDDAADPATVGLGFDAEGTPKRRTAVVDGGMTSAVLHNRRTARKAGTQSTGNAVEDGDQWGALPNNPTLAPGDRSDEELIGGVGRGLLVTDFWYVRILDPKTQVVTGLTRNGVWLVEDGRMVRPVSNLRFTQSYLDALGPGAVRGIGRERALISGGFDGVHLVPSIHLASWNFTGGAKG
jgi:predicted Zn-dependent protease